MLVQEAKGVHQQVHGHNQTVVEAAQQVHVKQLLPAPHTHLAGTILARYDHHKVRAGADGRDKGDAGGQVGDVVHCLSH